MALTSREDAAAALVDRLRPLIAGVPRRELLVLGIPRGGVVVAAEVARLLRAPLDVLVVRRLTAPGDWRRTLGAVGERDVIVVDADAVAAARLSQREMDALIGEERDHVARAAHLWRKAAPRQKDLHDRVVIVVDDGICTGATAVATLRAVAQENPRRIIVAAPVGAKAALERVRAEVADVVCLEEPAFMVGLGSCYERFSPVEDDKVTALLDRARERELADSTGAIALPPS